jgi:3-methyl-2-oxobutanoate hydroxymethyltransferase
MLTCYDYPSALIQDANGIDVIFVGDSLATNVLGYGHQNDLPLEDLRHHLRAVKRGVKRAYLLADIPFTTTHTLASILKAARALRADGAVGVKVEGFRPEVFRALAEEGIDGWAHLGFTPQLIARPAMQAKDADAARKLAEESHALEAAGALGLILELVPSTVAQRVARELSIPVIGIGAGPHCDGQVQVWHDLVGLETRRYRHAFPQCDSHALQSAAVAAYHEKVRSKAPESALKAPVPIPPSADA